MINAYQYAREEAVKRGSQLLGAAGECTWRSRQFWERMGWQRAYIDSGKGPIKEIEYVQPPLAFDLTTGQPAEGAGEAPEHFMADFFGPKMENAPHAAEKLAATVRGFYQTNNYVDRRAFPNDEAYRTHLAAVQPHADSFANQFQQPGSIRFLTKAAGDALKKSGRTVEDYITNPAEEGGEMPQPIHESDTL